MEKTVAYPVILKQEENDVFVTIPDLAGGYTQGNDFADAVAMAKDAMITLLENVNEQDYPKPSTADKFKLAADEKLVYVTK